MTERAELPKRRAVSIREVMGLIALVALACVWPGLIPTEVLGVVFWIRARRGDEAARERLISFGIVVAAVYSCSAAHFWLATFQYPALEGPQWRADWSKYFPIAPGLLVGAFYAILLSPLIDVGVHSTLGYAVVVFGTVTQVYLLTLIAGRTRTRRIIAAIIGVVLSFIGTFVLTFLTFLIPT